MKEISIVAYHYVRDFSATRYPHIKGMDIQQFKKQLDYLGKNFNFIDVAALDKYLHDNVPLPENPCLLTFDDGYMDHYIYVFPELYKRGISGAFFPPCEIMRGDKVLNVNKIHYILAASNYDGANIFPILKSEYTKLLQDKEGFESFENLFANFNSSRRFDSKEISFIKALLQYMLPIGERESLTQILFDELVPDSEKLLAKELYMNIDMLKIMANNGMHIGSHGDKHLWLDKIDRQAQEEEIVNSLKLLKQVYNTNDFMWSIAYPFGGNNTSLHQICEKYGCACGFTVEPGKALIDPSKKYELNRMDANDINKFLN